MKLSAVLIAYNEEANIRRALEPLQGLADEIVVVDSFSTDATKAIAEEMGATVHQEPFTGFIAKKNLALSKARGEWILCLDCDEVLTPELAASVRGAVAEPGPYAAYALNRRTFYMGRLLRHSWQPDRKIRLVRRDAGPRWGGYEPHDTLLAQGPAGFLAGDLVHYSFRDFDDHMRRTAAHARSAALSYFERGKRTGAADLLLRPPLAFLKKYLLRRGVLDGLPGLVAAISGGVYSYMKYAFLLDMQNRDRTSGDAPPGRSDIFPPAP